MNYLDKLTESQKKYCCITGVLIKRHKNTPQEMLYVERLRGYLNALVNVGAIELWDSRMLFLLFCNECEAYA